VGESGCGKSMTGNAILGLLEPPARIVQGRILFEGVDLLQQDEYEDSRGKRRRHQEVEEKPQESKETEPPVGRLMFHLVSRTILGAVGLSVKKRKF
jgi:ABC-type glutathione transport system ATPase component